MDQRTTYAINHEGSVNLARACKAAGVPRLVYTSSCSVYGFGSTEDCTETSPANPQTAYARCKVLVERDVGALADARFTPVFLRNATAFGASPRMRFDIVLNNLSGLAWTRSEIKMTSDGSPWRPLVHGLDIAQAIRRALDAPRDLVHAQTFNVGASDHNYRVREVAEIVGETFPGCTVSFGASGGDNRSYRVSFEKIATGLPGFSSQWDVRRGAQQLHDVFASIDMDDETFSGRGHTRLLQLQHLIATKQLDDALFWRSS
jgi:nucleoside-diphosphate-sugar epimerase